MESDTEQASKLVREFAELRESNRMEMRRIAQRMEEVMKREKSFVILDGETLMEALEREESYEREQQVRAG